MNRLKERFARTRRRRTPPVIPYLMAGHPSLDVTARLLTELDGSGVPIVEVGIPFSDPVADGPTIQAAATAALRGGTTIAGILDLLAERCPRLECAVVVMTYANPILAHGPDAFLGALERSGVAGLLPVDLPPEDLRGFFPGYKRSPVGVACLLTPASPEERIRRAVAAATGMLYLTSRLGVTGAKGDVPALLIQRLGALAGATPLPLVAGFGFSAREQIALVLPHCDGVVVGSALVAAMTNRAGDEAVQAYLGALEGLSPQGAGGPASGEESGKTLR